MKKLNLVVLLLVFSLLFTSAVFAQDKYGGEFTGFSSSDPKSLDPAQLGSWDQAVMAANVLEGLVRLSPDGRSIEPGVAKSWSVANDGLVWTFELREDAYFHDGNQVKAKDVKYSFERLIDPATKSPSAWIFDKVAGYSEVRNGDADSVSGIRVIDDYTLEIELTTPLTPFVSMLAAPGAAVVSEEAVNEYADQFGQNVVSAGPFKLSDWEQNLDITMTACENYWDGRPYLDTLKFKFIHDENTRVVELLTGNLDWAWVTPAHHNALTTNNKYKDHIARAHTLHAAYFIINMNKEPFGSNEDLRKAMSYALNRESVIDSLQGRADRAVGFFPPGFMGRNDEAPAYNYDPEMAKELLAEAGYPDGIDQTFTLVSLPWENLINILSIYQQNLREVGINIELNPVQYGEYMTMIQEGDFDLAYGYQVPDYADADGFVYPLLHSEGDGNVANYSNPEVDSLIEEGRAVTDEEQRTEIYEDITMILQQDLPYITSTHNIWVDVTDPTERNWVPRTMDIHMFHRVWMEE